MGRLPQSAGIGDAAVALCGLEFLHFDVWVIVVAQRSVAAERYRAKSMNRHGEEKR
jgi:hypothetical protein